MLKPHIYQQPQFGENWFSYKNLYGDMVRKFPSGSVFIEIGSWKGKSSAFMATEIANSKKYIDFYCIDTWDGSIEHQNDFSVSDLYNIFLNNMEPLKDYYKHIKTSSLQAAQTFENESVDFVFVDGSHTYQDVKNDILAWLPKIKKGGILAGHDYNVEYWYDLTRAVNDTLTPFVVDTKQSCYIYYKER